MRRLAAGAFVLGIVATFGQTIPSHAAVVDGPSGLLCGFTSTTDPGTEGGDVQTGEIDAGPLLAVDDTTTPPTPQSGTVHCTIQVGGSTHAAPDNGASASASGTGVIVLPATLVSYNSPANVPVYLCTSFTFQGGATIYFNDPNDPTVDGDWTDDPNSNCGLATEVETITCEDLVNVCDGADRCTGTVNVCTNTTTCENTINVCTGATTCTGSIANVCTGNGTAAPTCNGGGAVNICRPSLRRTLSPEQRRTRHSDLARRALDGHFRGARR
jgi:hypothetical protein